MWTLCGDHVTMLHEFFRAAMMSGPKVLMVGILGWYRSLSGILAGGDYQAPCKGACAPQVTPL